jgi:hypothetical protein
VAEGEGYMKKFKVTEKRISVRWCYLDAEDEDEAIELSVDVPDDRWEAFEIHEDVDYVEMEASEVI